MGFINKYKIYHFRLKRYIKSSNSYYLKEWYVKALIAFVQRNYFYKVFLRKTSTNFYVTISTWFGRSLANLSRNRFKTSLIKKTSKNIKRPFIFNLIKQIRRFIRSFFLKKCFLFIYCLGKLTGEMQAVLRCFFNTIIYMGTRANTFKKRFRILKIIMNPANAHNGFRKKKKRRL